MCVSCSVIRNTIGNYLRSQLLHAPWLAEKQPITGRYQHTCRTTTRTCILQTNRPLFPFDTNDETRNLDCWRSRLWVSINMWCTTRGRSSYERLYVGTQNSPFSSVWICTDQPPKLYETERIVTKTNAIFKSVENTSFCNYYSLLFFFISYTKYIPFFQPNCCLVPSLSLRLVLQ